MVCGRMVQGKMNNKGYVLLITSIAFLIAIIASFGINPEDFSGRTEFAGKTSIKLLEMAIDAQGLLTQKDYEIEMYIDEMDQIYVFECGKEGIYTRWDYENCYPSDENVGKSVMNELAKKDTSMEFSYDSGKIIGNGKKEITLKEENVEYKFMPYTSTKLENNYKTIVNDIVVARECIFHEIAKLNPNEADESNVINKRCFKDSEKWFAYYNFNTKDIFFEYKTEEKVLFVISKDKIPTLNDWQKNAINLFGTN